MNRPNRTITAALLAGTLVLTACGDDDEAPAPATQPPAATDDSMVDEEMTDDSMVDEEMMTDTTAAP